MFTNTNPASIVIGMTIVSQASEIQQILEKDKKSPK
jgi:hypothetical protein